MTETIETPLRCPSCATHMEPLELLRRPLGKLRVDLCFTCCVIWFDHGESAQLAPAAVIELFQKIQTHRSAQRNQLPPALSCPRCTEHLLLTHDICKSGPLSYYRCQSDGGRLTPFFQFLREKQFLRALKPVELDRVRAQVKQLQCSNCGAPIDLEHSTHCAYCNSPVSILDTDAVKNAMQMWAAAAERERNPDPEAIARALTLSPVPSSRPQRVSAGSPASDPLAGLVTGRDLIQVCIDALALFL